MAWCEANRLDFVFGLARNPRLVEELAIDLAWAEEDANRTGQSARRYKDFRWSTLDSWSCRSTCGLQAPFVHPQPVRPAQSSRLRRHRGERPARRRQRPRAARDR